MKQDRANRRHIVLLGIGHTNAHIVRMWAMHPLPDTDLTCISDSGIATYSGFLPAVLAGQLPPDAMAIDLVRLCAAAGARLITQRVTGLDRNNRQVLFDDRPPVSWDVLSIGIGSVPQMPQAGSDAASLVTIKPMRTFVDRLTSVVARLTDSDEPLKVIVVGAGAAGVEVTQCLPARLRSLTDRSVHITLVNRGSELLPGCIPATSQRVQRLIEERGHTILLNNTVIQVGDDAVQLQTGTDLPADVVIWATAATAPGLLSRFDLLKDDRGFLLTDQCLQSTSGDPVFAVGDTGTMQHGAVPKAGVYAVRQGPILWDNIQRLLNDKPLVPYEPQKSFLKLLNMGDGTAVGEWHGFCFGGRFALWLKQRIDQQFMDKYQLLPDKMAMPDDMQCRGCGCKLGGDVLDAALTEVSDEPKEDATIIPANADNDVGTPLLVTTDFFSAPFSDAWLSGRVAAIHAASDVFAMGAIPFAAEAIIVLPDGDITTQQQMLSDFQQGANKEFQRMGARITGGHTITGPRWETGFTVFGRPIGTQLIRKQGLKPGDRLFLTKPLGSGILMAALMRGQCRHTNYDALLNTMLDSNQPAAEIAVNCGVVAGTDITGFGLLGHLYEMLTNDVRVTVQFDSVPLICGARECAERGIASSLLPSNRAYLRNVSSERGSELDLLLDPQTCGGLLLAVSADRMQEFCRAFDDRELTVPSEIGQIDIAKGDTARITVS